MMRKLTLSPPGVTRVIVFNPCIPGLSAPFTQVNVSFSTYACAVLLTTVGRFCDRVGVFCVAGQGGNYPGMVWGYSGYHRHMLTLAVSQERRHPCLFQFFFSFRGRTTSSSIVVSRAISQSSTIDNSIL